MVLLLQVPAVVPALPDRRIDLGDITVYTDRAHVPLATALGEAAAQPHAWPGLGRVDPGRLLLVLVRNQREFTSWSRGLPSWGAGVTFPDSRVVIIRLDAGDPFQTLRHELAHVALHHEVHVRLPLWFDEGYAVVAAQEFGRFAALRLNLAVATGKVPELRGVDGALRGNTTDAETAYALAGSAVTEMMRRGRNGTLDDILAKLKHGIPFETAVADGTGFSLDRFDEVWRKSLRQHYNWLVWLATGGAWLLMTLVLSWAAVSRRRREAPRRAALDIGWPEPVEDDETITIEGVKPHST